MKETIKNAIETPSSEAVFESPMMGRSWALDRGLTQQGNLVQWRAPLPLLLGRVYHFHFGPHTIVAAKLAALHVTTEV